MPVLVIRPYPEDATVTVNGNTATNNYFTITAGDFALINVSKNNYVTSSSRIQINEDLYLNVRLEKVKDSGGGGSGDMNNPMTTQGDIIVGGTGGDPTRLGIGSAGEVLKVNSSGTGLEYGTGGGSGDMTNPMTTAGDIIVGGANGDPARLGIGNNGQILKVVSGALAYADDATGDMNNPMTTQGDLIVGGASGTPQRLGIGTAGQILKVNSQANGFEFANETGGMSNPMTTAGDVIVGGASGTPTRLGMGTAGQVLKVNASATGLEFADESGGGSGSVDIVYWD